MKYDVDYLTYRKVFQDIISSLTRNEALKKNHAVLFLGGQPGAGKSTFSSMDYNFTDYIVIDGDQYRRYHPDYKSIAENDIDKMAELTQPFVNRVVEDLIVQLSKEGYNLIIEGTLRDASVPIATSRLLKKQGYMTELYVIACDACESWESTVSRAKLMQEIGQTPRIVPIEKYESIVKNLPQSLQAIEESGTMDKIMVINRECKIIWRNDVQETDHYRTPAFRTLEKVLNLSKWDECLENYKNEISSPDLQETDKEECFHRRKRGGR